MDWATNMLTEHPDELWEICHKARTGGGAANGMPAAKGGQASQRAKARSAKSGAQAPRKGTGRTPPVHELTCFGARGRTRANNPESRSVDRMESMSATLLGAGCKTRLHTPKAVPYHEQNHTI